MRLKIFIYSLSVLLAGFYSCGSKKIDTKVDPKKDTTTVKNNVDTTKISSDNPNNNTNVGVTDDGINIDPNASPENAVKTIIRAGKTGKYGMLAKLCNEAVDMDGDAKDICNVASKKEGDQKGFRDYFGNAKIVGQARVKNGIAEVDIETTAEGGSKETIVLQMKYDKWYLKGM